MFEISGIINVINLVPKAISHATSLYMHCLPGNTNLSKREFSYRVRLRVAGGNMALASLCGYFLVRECRILIGLLRTESGICISWWDLAGWGFLVESMPYR